MTFNQETFNSGNGTMDKQTFDLHAKEYGVEQAVWVAKYFGVALSQVKQWASQYILNR